MHKNVFIFIKMALCAGKDDAGTAERIRIFCGEESRITTSDKTFGSSEIWSEKVMHKKKKTTEHIVYLNSDRSLEKHSFFLSCFYYFYSKN